MNIKRIVFWVAFLVILGLIVWGLIAAMGKAPTGPKVGDPAPVSATDNILGPSDAPVTMIEYSDFQCPACQAYHPLIKQVLASSTVPVRLVYRHFPLPQHKNATLAAQAAEAAGLQGKFWQMHNLLFENNLEWVDLANPADVFAGFAQRLGINVEKFKADLNSSPIKAKVQAQLTEAQSLGLFQTPTFFLNGKMIENPQSYEKFISAIETAAK